MEQTPAPCRAAGLTRIPRAVAAPGIAALAFVLAAAAPAQQHLLRHALVPGSAFGYALTVHARSQQTMAGRTLDVDMRFVLHLAATVRSASGGTAVVAHRLHRIEAKATTPVQTIDYDSQKPGSDAGKMASLAEMLDKEFLVEVTELGRILKVSEPKDLSPEAKQQLGGDLDSLFAQYFVEFPEQPVPVDGTWETTANVFDPGQREQGGIKVENRLVRVAGGRAEIARTYGVEKAATRPGGLKAEVKKAAGAAVLDLATGRILDSGMELAVELTRPLAGQEVHGTQTVVVSLQPEAPPAPAPAKTDKR
jgi:hypothetical protein